MRIGEGMICLLKCMSRLHGIFVIPQVQINIVTDSVHDKWINKTKVAGMP